MQPSTNADSEFGRHEPRPARPLHDELQSPIESITSRQKERDETIVGNLPPLIRSFLDYSEIRKLGTWQQIRASYAERGMTLGSDDDCLEQVRKDWGQIRSLQFQEAKTAPIPESYPRTTVVVAGQQIDIIGIWHTEYRHPDVDALLRKSIAGCPLLLTEQNLGLQTLGLHSHGFDLPDHYARGFPAELLDYEIRQVQAAWKSLKLGYHRLSGKMTIQDLVDEGFLQASTVEGKTVESMRNNKGFTAETISALSRLSLHMPGDAGEDLPVNVELAYKHEKKIPYSMVQARSAYMAEFLKAWDVEEMLKSSGGDLSKVGTAGLSVKKQLLCGQAHEPQVAFFLEFGSREERVIARAKQDAEKVNRGGIDELLSLYRQSNLNFTALMLPVQLAKGLAAGWLAKELILSLL